jgi:hypothetical protein
MMNIKSSLFYAALAACLGTGYGAHYLVSGGEKIIRVPVPQAECEDTSGRPRLDKTPRPLSRGGSY